MFASLYFQPPRTACPSLSATFTSGSAHHGTNSTALCLPLCTASICFVHSSGGRCSVHSLYMCECSTCIAFCTSSDPLCSLFLLTYPVCLLPQLSSYVLQCLLSDTWPRSTTRILVRLDRRRIPYQLPFTYRSELSLGFVWCALQ